MATGNPQFEPGDEICPPWWPRLIFSAHFPPKGIGPGGPVNFPPDVNAILSALAIHALSYHLLDAKVAETVRGQAVQQIVSGASKLRG
jgi:hypothetical protein